MSDTQLYVPLEVQALVVNDKVRSAQGFQRWTMDYQSVGSYVSPTPTPFSSNTAGNWSNEPEANGVYLHWSLPDCLRTGVQNNAETTTIFPLVPNRWLVVRYSGLATSRIATGWVIESDYLDPNKGTSPFLDPFASSPQPTALGRKVTVTDWSETGTNKLFLTVLAPGNVTFASYQPSVEDVFSIHDPLDGVADSDTLSYLVIGWYSDPTSDILASWGGAETFSAFISSLGWSVSNSSLQSNRSVYHGGLWGISWDKLGALPNSSRPTDPATVSLAIGNTSIDALTAFIEQQAATQGSGETVDAQLLEAFQYDLLPLIATQDGAEQLEQAIHQAWFGASGSGYLWVIVKKPQSGTSDSYPSATPDWDDPILESSWLAILNQNQSNFDNTSMLLRSKQLELYNLWWTRGHFNNLSPQQQQSLQGITDSLFAQQLDPQSAGSLASEVQSLLSSLSNLLNEIPHGDTQSDLDAAIASFAQSQQLPPDYELKRYAKGDFYSANDPVVLLAGAQNNASLVNEGDLQCRFSDQLVTGISYQGASITVSSLKGGIPSIASTSIPIQVTGLINEFFFLDPGNASIIASVVLDKTDPQTISDLQDLMSSHQSIVGSAPDFALSSWQQPWAPLFIMWQAQYYSIPFESTGQGNWSFDGTSYQWLGTGAQTTPFAIDGMTFLTPKSSYNFKCRLLDYLNKHPDLDSDKIKDLEDFIDSTDHWDFLSQSLEGFSSQLICRMTDSNITPTDQGLITLIGEETSSVPQLGDLPQPFKGWPQSNFQDIRSGQFVFTRFALVDRFGQSLDLITSDTALQFKPFISPDLMPQKTVIPDEPYRFIEVPPRLLQPACLRFDFVDSNNDGLIVDEHTSVNPIAAWIIPNQLDSALSCFSPGGDALGELRVISPQSGTKQVQWFPAPGIAGTDLATITKSYPHLGSLLTSLIQLGEQAFDNFFLTIDQSLWTIDPLGARDDQTLSVLIGRPLALVRCQLRFLLAGPAYSDPSWQFTFNNEQPNFINYLFPVRLGESSMLSDGLIGYYLNDTYTQFNTVRIPTGGLENQTPPYIVQIQPGNFINLSFNDSSVAFVTMLMDPRAEVHATTSILPVTSVKLSTKYVDPALQKMEITFGVGPILSTTEDAAQGDTLDSGSKQILNLPIPSTRAGQWSWRTLDGSVVPLENANSDAQFSDDPACLRTGYMQLTNGLSRQVGGRVVVGDQ